MLNAGDRFGDYEVAKPLGKGGMGAVYLLENDAGVQVAAKLADLGIARGGHVYFNGDAPVFKNPGRPVLGSQLSDFEIVVCAGSRGWMNCDSPELPPVWPVSEGENSRRIRCRDAK